MCCQHRDRGTCGTWNTRTWSSSACGACFPGRWPGVSSGTCCTWRNKPRRGCCWWRPGNVRGGVVPRPANEGGRTAGPRRRGGGLLCGSRLRASGRVHLRTCGRCESGAGTRVRSVGIHDDVGSHVPETRGKVRVPRGRTFMQNCVKRSRGLTYLV